jgi:ribonuclease-3
MPCELYSNSEEIEKVSPPLRRSSPPPVNHVELNRTNIESIIGMRPLNIKHYQQAFVHKSVQKYSKGKCDAPEYMKESYERYEYLGDSVLNLVVANYLFVKYNNEAEGFLTRIRTKLVNGKTLSNFAKKINLGKYIIMSSNVEHINGRTNNRILEDVFESLICAIYLDLGFKNAETFIIDCIHKYINIDDLETDDNYKDILLRFCQGKMQSIPTYSTINTEGPPHDRDFTVVCLIQGMKYKQGQGKCKKIAEQNSARETLRYFGQIN